eukprot:6202391-Pleurochrysis_carterae.AAC.3
MHTAYNSNAQCSNIWFRDVDRIARGLPAGRAQLRTIPGRPPLRLGCVRALLPRDSPHRGASP